MAVELTEQQQLVVHQSAGEPVELIDPQTNRIYVLITGEQFAQVRPTLAVQSPSQPPTPERQVAEGIRRSLEAFWRDLPQLLKKKKLRGQWVAYHCEERVGIAADGQNLVRECIRRGYKDNEYYVGWIDEGELIEEPELEVRDWNFGEE